MPITLPDEGYDEVIECWGISPNTIQVTVNANKRHDHQHTVRITAMENIKTGATPRYFAMYEEPAYLDDDHEKVYWVETRYPWQDGESVEECLMQALPWVIIGNE